MRAGKLTETITIKTTIYVDDGWGGQKPETVVRATLRAGIIDESTEEFIRSYGTSTERLRIFRTRWIDDVLPEDVIEHDGIEYNLKQVKPIGRRRGLELRCTRIGA